MYFELQIITLQYISPFVCPELLRIIICYYYFIIVARISFAENNMVIPIERIESEEEVSNITSEENQNKTSWKNIHKNNDNRRKIPENSETLQKTTNIAEYIPDAEKDASPEIDKSKEVQTDTSFIMDTLKGFENIKIKYYEQRCKYMNEKEGTIKRVVEIFSDYGKILETSFSLDNY